ncbi:MAG TPA: CvpA family protein [Candidatus Dormibacteraeota bacterium]|nr:CvpA family protein [Candidatus Dormibacteraeota bacterium]
MSSLSIDLIAVFLIIVNVLLGWRFGILGRALALGGLYGGVAAATAMSSRLLRLFGGGGAANDLYATAWTFIAVVFGVVAMVEILGALYRDRVEKVISLMFDRTTGIVAGLVVGLFQAAIVVMVALAVGNAQTSGPGEKLPSEHGDTANAVYKSVIGSHIAGLSPAIDAFFGPALPASLSGYLAGSTSAVASTTGSGN